MKLYKQAQKYGAKIAAGASTLMLSAVAFAQATPVSTATGAIEGAQADLTTVFLALLTMAVGIWAIVKIIRIFSSR